MWYMLLPQFTPLAPTLFRESVHRPGWVYEEKVDGYWMLAYKEGAASDLSAATALTISGGSPN
jgi:hypothetical protein